MLALFFKQKHFYLCFLYFFACKVLLESVLGFIMYKLETIDIYKCIN